MKNIERAEQILEALSHDGLRFWDTDAVEHHTIVLVTEYYPLASRLLVGSTDNGSHSDTGVCIARRNTIFFLVFRQRIVYQSIQPLY